jgi:PAS domain S-box-containing protein
MTRSALSEAAENTFVPQFDAAPSPGSPDGAENPCLPDGIAVRQWAEAVASRYAPAFIVVDQHGAEIQRSDRADRYAAAGGAELAARMGDDLRDAVRHLLEQAARDTRPARANAVAYATPQPDGSVALGRVDLIVERMPPQAAGSASSSGAAAPGRRIILFLEPDPRNAAQVVTGSGSAFAANQELVRLMGGIVPAFLFTTAADLSVSDMNATFYSYTGLSEHRFLAGGWALVIHPDDLAENRRRWVAARHQGGVFEHEHRLRAADGSWRWFLSRSVPQHDAQGQVVRWFGSAVDIHQRHRDEISQRMVLAEVQHRAKNVLAVVRSLVSRTLETAIDLDDFAAHLSGRIAALARTQNALGRTFDGSVGLEELAHQEVLAHGGQVRDQVRIEGPNVMLTDKVAETMGLALHELTTNALKFGALSVRHGTVRIWWDVLAPEDTGQPNGDQRGTTRLALVWEEVGVTIPEPNPAHSGFGRELIERGLPYELGARTKLRFRPRGVRCDIEMTVKQAPEGSPLDGEAP